MTDTPGAGQEVWDRYLDWCSARISEHLLTLSHEELWFRAYGSGATPEWSPASFAEVIQALSHDVFLELRLPDFPSWRTLYEQDPRPFDDDLAHIPRTPSADRPRRAQL